VRFWRGWSSSSRAEFVAHGRELRAYELFALLSVLFAFALEAEVRAPSVRHALALGGCTAAGSLTHYFFLFTVAAGLIWLWIEPQALQARRQATMAVVSGLTICLSWTPVLLRQYHQHRFSWIGGFQAQTALNTVLRLFTPLPRPGAVATSIGALVLVSVCCGAVILSLRSRRGRLCAFLALAPLGLASLAWLIGFRIYSVRNMIGIGAFAAIAIAAAISALAPPVRTAVAAIVGCLMIGVFVWDQNTPATPYNKMASALVAEGWRASNPIAVLGDLAAFRSPLEWYLPGFPVLARVSAARATEGTLYAIAPANAAWPFLRDSRTYINVGRFLVVRLHESALMLPHGASILAAQHTRGR
jgi:hypothetical protein